MREAARTGRRTLSPREADTVQRAMNVIALVKDTERYVFLYDDDSSSELMQQLGRFAADTELSFTWYDAAVLSQKVRRLRQDYAQQPPRRHRDAA